MTFDECESEKCVDLKTVFSITDYAESRIQKFNVSFMTQVEASIQDFNEIIFGEQKTISVENDARKYIPSPERGFLIIRPSVVKYHVNTCKMLCNT